MKKILFVVLLLTASNAFAIDNVYRPYVGVDYVYSTLDNKNIDSYLNSGTIIIGSEYNKYFSTEVFYQKSLTKSQQTKDGKLKSSIQGYGLDMYAYLPLGCAQRFAPYATAGFGKYSAKRKIDATSRNDKDGEGYRFGAGLNYHLNNDLSLRSGYRYVKFNHISTIDHADELTLGMRYAF